MMRMYMHPGSPFCERSFFVTSGPYGAAQTAIRVHRLGTEDKLPAAEDYLKQLGLGWHQAAAMGDDWPDLPMMQRAAMACPPLNAHSQPFALAHCVTTRPGGFGAGRMFL